MESGAERRKFLRLSLDPPIEVKVRTALSENKFFGSYKRALIKNVSIAGGLLIEFMVGSKGEAGNLLAGKEKLYIEADISQEQAPFKILGKVAWLKKSSGAAGEVSYEAGISFENLDEKIKEDILHAMIDLAFKQNRIV